MARIAGIGFNTGGVFGDLDLFASRLERYERLGCTTVEVTAVGLDAVSACRLIPHRVSTLREILDRHAMTRSLHAPIAINLMDEAHLDLQKRAAVASLELAAELAATTVVIHPGRCHPRQWATQEPQLLALERAALGEVAERARALGVAIAYENISPNPQVIAGQETSYSLDPRRLAEQLEALDHPAVVACLDVSHAQQGAGLLGFHMVSASASLAPRIAHLHYSDSTGVPATIATKNDGERQFFGVGDMHAPAGWGAIDFDTLGRSLDVAQGARIVIELRESFHHHAEAQTLDAARRFAELLEGANT